MYKYVTIGPRPRDGGVLSSPPTSYEPPPKFSPGINQANPDSDL